MHVMYHVEDSMAASQPIRARIWLRFMIKLMNLRQCGEESNWTSTSSDVFSM